MKANIIRRILFGVAILILSYDLIAGERIDPWIIACIVLVIAALLFDLFKKPKNKK